MLKSANFRRRNTTMTIDPAIQQWLADLLRAPRESLEVELKGWLDIQNDAEHKATLAKALIALANHGGGYVVFGFEENAGCVAPAEPRPGDLAAYTPDVVNSIVSRFAEPQFHCDVQVLRSPLNGLEYPIAVVPGGNHVPIRSRRSGPGERVVQSDRYYIRRPGPNSEPPQSGQEWDLLIRRCIANARQDLVDQFRLIMAGGAGVEAAQSDLDRLTRWFDFSAARWSELVETSPEHHMSRLSNGYYTVAYQITGDFDPPAGGALRSALQRGRLHRHILPPFDTLSQIYPYDGNIEHFQYEEPRAPAHADYWRVSPSAQFFLRRGYEDDFENPGLIFDIDLPIWRIAEILLHAASMAETFGDPRSQILLIAEWTGLAGRSLARDSYRRRQRLPHESRQGSHRQSLQVQADAIIEHLPDLLHRLLHPLFEQFDFFDLSMPEIISELAEARRWGLPTAVGSLRT